MRFSLPLALLSGLLTAGLPARAAHLPIPLTPKEAAAKHTLLSLVRREDAAVLVQDDHVLHQIFVRGSRVSDEAYRHAHARAAFLAAWGKARGVDFNGVQVTLRTPSIRFVGDSRIQLFAIVSEAFRYASPLEPHACEQFGIGVHHVYVIEQQAGQWRIRSDDFTDPLDQDSRIPGDARPELMMRVRTMPLHDAAGTRHTPSSTAARALLYARRFCGAAPGCGNRGRYHPRYNDYNGDGGDCTNFASQALRAGRFRETPVWSYDPWRGEGSPAWANAGALMDFLTASGRATQYAYGTFRAMTRATTAFPAGAVSRLRAGDLIAYEERGRIVHFAVVVGRNPFDYVVVNSHTADRYRVPWDIGWDRHTVFHLLHVHYPERPPRSGADAR